MRELEQLLQCLESQKRRRILGETGNRQIGDMTTTMTSSSPITSVANPLISTGNVTELEGGGGGIREETAENKSCLADVEVKLLGFDAMIKILSRRRPGQLIKTIAALEDLHLSILHTNITTMEQTVLYSFNVKASFTFLHYNYRSLYIVHRTYKVFLPICLDRFNINMHILVSYEIKSNSLVISMGLLNRQ